MIRLVSLLLLTSFSLTAFAQMRNDEDRKISLAITEQFRRECNHRSGLDQSKILDLQAMFDKVRKDTSNEGKTALQCYEERMSQLVGIFQLYKELCEEISRGVKDKPEKDQLRLLYMSQKYRKGITPFHDLLNDCLNERANPKYLVKVAPYKTEGAALENELNKLEIKPPFEASRVDFR